MALPCIGSRELGKLEAGQIIFACIYPLLGELIQGLEEMKTSTKNVEGVIKGLLRKMGKMTTRAITRELIILLPRCPDHIPQILSRMKSKRKIKSEFSSEDRGFVWWVEV